MKNQLQTNKLRQHAKPETLQAKQGTLYLEAGEYINESHNGTRSPDQALKAFDGRVRQYQSFYSSMASQAKDLDQMELCDTFAETSRLMSPWKAEELTEFRKVMDGLRIEGELLLTSISADVLYEMFERGEQQ